MMRWLLSISSLLLAFVSVSQPTLPEYGPLFSQDEVASIFITIHEDSLALILHPDSAWSNHEFPATFVYQSSELNDTVHNIGFRLRGNTSRLAEKKSFKVSFNTFVNNGEYLGMEKLNLNGEHNDPSILRSRLCWEIFRSMGLPGSRTSHVRLHINEEYRGLYLNVEHFDEEFTDRVFDNGQGNLYKCYYPANLHYIDNNPESYKFELWGRRVYELKTNTDADDYSRLAEFIDVLNNEPIESLPCTLESVFNVYDYLKIAAVDVLTGNWDGYIFNNNNFYLYENQKTGKMEFIPYDLDNTLGVDWFGMDWTERDVYEWQNDDDYRPLFERLMQVEKYRNAYSFYIDEIIDNYLGNDALENRAMELQQLIEDAALEDEYRTLDYGFSTDDFLDAISVSWGEHVDYSISEFEALRSTSAEQQLEEFFAPHVAHHLRDNSPEIDTLAFKLLIENQNFNSAYIKFQINNGDWQELDLLDDGTQQDWEADDGLYGATLNIGDEDDRLDYFAVVEWDGETIQYPCDTVLVWLSPGESEIVLNELMAINQNTVSDELGEFDDWAELYNNGSGANYAGNYFLTDNADEPDKWQVPNITIESDDHLLLWTDGEPEQGPLHANFKLSGQGEELYLYGIEEGAFRVLDWIDFDAQQSDVSFGRQTDAHPDWILFDIPTPNAANGLVSVWDEDLSDFIVYPNPSSGLVFFSETVDVQVRNSTGLIVMASQNCQYLDLAFLPTGMYFLSTKNGVYKVVINSH